MKQTSDTFKEKSSLKAFDLGHRRTINFNIGRYNAVVPQGKQQFAAMELARERAKNIKWRALESLDAQLETFETAISRRGGQVIWAEDAAQALDEVRKICEARNCKTLIKSKSMVTEEIHLNAFLEKMGIESIETDLGEYIQQLDGEAPYHIVTPAMHKSKEDIARLFADKLGTDPLLTPAEMTLVARDILRAKYREAEVGVTGANFIVADIGGVAITENEGNARLSSSMPRTHIVIVGIEKVIPTMADLGLFWPLLATFGTGQRITSYNTIITGPRQPGESDGPEEMFVILLDNGRTRILANEKQRESLYCIRCGACLNACPVYKNIGGHAYGATYSGPIGSVITPNLEQLDEFKHLSQASSLCGNCTEVCAVKINLHELLLDNRHQAAVAGMAPMSEKIAWKLWRMAMLKRNWMNMTGGGTKARLINIIGKSWTKHHGSLQFPKKSFNQQWADRKSG